MRLALFDDYTPGSYHVRKDDLLAGLREQSVACGLRLRAVLIVGPLGMLWAYHVAVFIDEGDEVRVNVLAMPHARITRKSTTTVTPTTASAWLDDVVASRLLRTGLPATAGTAARGDAEFSYNLLLAIFDGAEARYRHAEFNGFVTNAGTKDLLDRVNRVLGTTAPTYGHGDVPRQ